ncbi:MAG TPA: alkane 1-monooxygenase [Paracoccaceae bacterium]|nr:alkane 1-monooxygenase [Paracoccaceae bacterium]
MPANSTASFAKALPFWISLLFPPLVWWVCQTGGWAILSLPAGAMALFILIDAVAGATQDSLDPETAEADLFWYRLITLVWAPLQFVMIFGALAAVAPSGDLSTFEKWGIFVGVGFVAGAIGIVYAHELMHQKPKIERLMGDLLMCMVLYGHFRTEHLLVHHRYVGTPRDAVTARYNESFYRFFLRVLPGSLISAFRAEQAMLLRAGLPWWSARNPFWRYLAFQSGFLGLAALIGGWLGLWLFVTQAFVAVFYLELINYVEHYGLTRKHLGGGKYEHVKPRHSWNSDYKVSNWLLINLQRHSDHHYKPDRRFPLLQTYGPQDAPQLPSGYPFIAALALIPPIWRRKMNPRVRKWRAMYYPEITDWVPYKTGTNPLPR